MTVTQQKSLLKQFKLNKKIIVKFDFDNGNNQGIRKFIDTITYTTSSTNPPTMDSQSLL